jgi:myo-inositol-1(or 4)-monophosphatase
MDRFIQRIAKKAGDAVLKRFGKEGEHYRKSDRLTDIVTKSDLLAEKIIIDAIRAEYPDHGIISEESGAVNEGAEYVWVIDPIDGTMNYARGVVTFGVMLCLVRRGEVILSVINMPALKELYYAKAGKGAYLNGKRIRCSPETDIKKTYGVGSSSLRARNARFLKSLITAARDMQMLFGTFGAMSANTCVVASGRRDWIVALNGSIWDFAPATLILKEAGCKVTDMDGQAWKFGMLEMVAANPALHKNLLKLTKGI